MKICEFIGGAYIYAECVKTGLGKLVWDSHPLTFKKPQKFNHARQVFTDLGDPYKQNELRIKIGSCFKFECPKDPDVKQAADLLMELSSSASSSSAAPVWSDEMYPCFQRFEPEVVRLKMQGVPEICVS